MLYGLYLLNAYTLACHLAVLCLFNVGKETLLGNTALVVAVLALVHCKLPKLLVVLSLVPAKLFHLLAVRIKRIGVEALRVSSGELVAFLLCKRNNLWRNFTRQVSALTQNHTPHALVHAAETWLVLSI